MGRAYEVRKASIQKTGAAKAKLYSMYAFKWRFKAFASNFISRKLGAWFTYKYCKRPSN